MQGPGDGSGDGGTGPDGRGGPAPGAGPEAWWRRAYEQGRRWRRWRPRSWGALALVLLVVAVTGTAAAGELIRRARLADNRAQLQQACRGLLPQDVLRPYLPDGSRGRLVEYGTTLGTDPAHGTRALFDCRLSWEGGGPRGEHGAAAEIRAVALTRPDGSTPDLPQTPDTAFPLVLPPSALGATTARERMVFATIVVTCPDGRRGPGGSGRDLQVRAGLPRAPAEGPGGAARRTELLAVSRTAVAVADWVTARLGCGGAPLGGLPEARSGPEGGAASGARAWCDSVAPGAHGLGDDWIALPPTSYTTRLGFCGFRRDGARDSGDAESLTVTSAVGGWGLELHALRESAPALREDRAWQWNGGDQPSADAWASSVCGGVRAYHRVALTPLVRPGPDGVHRLPRETVRTLHATAHRVLAAYLAAEGAWPRRTECRDTTVLRGRS
ncbi:hypothetical protein ACWDR0_07535 [Streptomyces sp. NPDC003691]